MTKQRRVILEELRKARTHPTANELYQMVLRRLPDVSLGTVYRSLDVLSEQGLIRKLESSFGCPGRFDGDLKDHYHIRCVSCGRVDDIDLERNPTFDGAVSRSSGYEITGFRLEFVGTCPRCSRKGSKSKRKTGTIKGSIRRK